MAPLFFVERLVGSWSDLLNQITLREADHELLKYRVPDLMEAFLEVSVFLKFFGDAIFPTLHVKFDNARQPRCS